eukprot:SAG11_NODE_7151_length_1186_cov_1.182153_1_plen_69_part_10
MRDRAWLAAVSDRKELMKAIDELRDGIIKQPSHLWWDAPPPTLPLCTVRLHCGVPAREWRAARRRDVDT